MNQMQRDDDKSVFYFSNSRIDGNCVDSTCCPTGDTIFGFSGSKLKHNSGETYVSEEVNIDFGKYKFQNHEGSKRGKNLSYISI